MTRPINWGGPSTRRNGGAALAIASVAGLLGRWARARHNGSSYPSLAMAQDFRGIDKYALGDRAPSPELHPFDPQPHPGDVLAAQRLASQASYNACSWPFDTLSEAMEGLAASWGLGASDPLSIHELQLMDMALTRFDYSLIAGVGEPASGPKPKSAKRRL